MCTHNHSIVGVGLAGRWGVPNTFKELKQNARRSSAALASFNTFLALKSTASPLLPAKIRRGSVVIWRQVQKTQSGGKSKTNSNRNDQ